MSRLAAIDIGTNSTKVTIADVTNKGKLTIVREESDVTRLGAGVDANHRLGDGAMAKTLEAIARFADLARESGAERVVAAGTSALRDAENGGEFLRQVKERTGIEIEIVTGDREASLAFAGVLSEPWLAAGKRPVCVFDIGGGSTELIIGKSGQVERHISLDIGAVRVTERFFHSDPPNGEETGEALRCIHSLLRTFEPPEDVPVLIGVGGTVVNIAAVHVLDKEPDEEGRQGLLLSGEDVMSVMARVCAAPLAERKKIPGLDPKRADVIVAGALILSRVLSYLKARQFRVSTRGVRHGLLVETAKKL